MSSANLKSCELYHLPPSLYHYWYVRWHFPFFVSLLQDLSWRLHSPSHKWALVFSALKNPDPALYQHYSPISSLFFLKLLNYKSPSNFFFTFNNLHFFYPANLALEPTTLLKLIFSLCFLMFTRQWTNHRTHSSCLFDVSAAFDKVDHQILLEHLETSCGFKGLPLL